MCVCDVARVGGPEVVHYAEAVYFSITKLYLLDCFDGATVQDFVSSGSGSTRVVYKL